MTTVALQPLNDQQLRQWETEGYRLLRGVIPAENIRAMRGMFERVFDQYIAQLKTEGLVTALDSARAG